MVWLTAPVRAQGPVSSFHIKTSVKGGVRFKVDGQTYLDAATFLWPQGSKHIVEFPVEDDGFQYRDARYTRYAFQGWADTNSLLSNASGRITTVTADPGVAGLTANIIVQHQVVLNFFEGFGNPPSSSPPVCGAPGPALPNEFRTGVVTIDGQCYWNSGLIWMAEGRHALNAFPYPGFVFIGWKADSQGSSAYLREFNFLVQGPLTIAPRFSPAKRVRFRTDPPGLKVMVDRAEVPTTDVEPCVPNNYQGSLPPATIEPLCIGEFDFEPGSTHVIGASSPQTDKFGGVWIFDSFSNGQANHSSYLTGPTVFPSDTVVAKLVRGVSTSYVTVPSGLKLRINDRDNWGSNHFVYAPGTTQKVEAPLEQVDSRGRKYAFKKWSDGGAAAHEFTVPDDTSQTYRLIAEYELLSQLVVLTNPLGSEILVDGAACAIPCKIDRVNGTEVQLSAPETTQISDSHRLEFVTWSDGAARERTAKITGAESQTLTARFRTAFRLTVALDPAEGAQLVFDPPSPDGYYEADSVVTVSAEGGPGLKFRRWEGDLAGTSRVATLAMIRPRTVIARFDRVPFIAPAGIRNAAGQTPENIVAPGSLISVFGANLAPSYEVGPSNPLLQAIAGVSVVVGNRILPLMFVSPDQINAQLPRDLGPGEHVLRVIRTGETPIEGKFTVAESAPGLFSRNYDGQAFAFAVHEDGSPVTAQNPARKGERITVYGTGFGAYTTRLPEGFALPEAPAFELAYTVEIQAGELSFGSDWAGGAAGMVGMDLFRFRVPEGVTGVTGVPLKVKLNGHESNTVLLPVE
jgi:uncharacterized protein (TIGR03437 family)